MKIIRNIILYSLTAIGIVYLVMIYHANKYPEGGTFMFGEGKCEEKILSSQSSPNKKIIAIHEATSCEGGLNEHILKISYKNSNEESLNQIFYSTRIKELSEFKGKIRPLGFKWKSNNKLILTVQPELNGFTHKFNTIDIVTKIDVYRP